MHDAKVFAVARLILFLLWMGLVWTACKASNAGSECPTPFLRNERRVQRLWDRLDDAPEGAALVLRTSAKPLVCFGPTEHSVVTTEHIMLLDTAMDDNEAAARFGHLLMHVVEGMPMRENQAGNCDARVDAALREEARALSYELRLRRQLGVQAKRIQYEFEEPYWATSEQEREPFVWKYLLDHPEGAPGIDALASGYAKQCQEK